MATRQHGDYHQPGPHHPDNHHDEDYLAGRVGDDGTRPDQEPEPDQEPVADADQAWHDQQPDAGHDGAADSATHSVEPGGEEPSSEEPSATAPAAFDRRAAGCGCGSTFDLRPFTRAELTACRTRVVVHVHVSDRTLIDQHGMLRTSDGPVTLDQFRRWLTDTDPNITIRPVLDPAQVAAVDSYEIPIAIREAIHARHPGSVWPYSPATTITAGGRLDLDHTIAYQHGPPGQTWPGNLGPLTRSEHRAKSLTGWQARQPDPGTYLWRSPHGWIALTTNQGTLMLGDTAWANQIWQTAQALRPATAPECRG